MHVAIYPAWHTDSRDFYCFGIGPRNGFNICPAAHCNDHAVAYRDCFSHTPGIILGDELSEENSIRAVRLRSGTFASGESQE